LTGGEVSVSAAPTREPKERRPKIDGLQVLLQLAWVQKQADQ
jgi:hypothetical protein